MPFAASRVVRLGGLTAPLLTMVRRGGHEASEERGGRAWHGLVRAGPEVRRWLGNEESPENRAFSSAPKRTRTSTGRKFPHKALNLVGDCSTCACCAF
jgi:hypothetical protein